MQRVKTLIDKAIEVCGSQTALALNLGVHKSQLSGMKNGGLKIAPDLAILIADIGKQNVADAALAAIIENGLNTKRGKRVQEVLGRAILGKMLEQPGSEEKRNLFEFKT